VRKWTKSACVVVIALGIAFLVAVTGWRGSAQPAQASTRTASSTSRTQAGPASAPARLMTVAAAPAAVKPPVTWAVRPGDTLTGIAAALHVPGGWQRLYAANRQLIGPDPNVIRPGTVLTVSGQETPLRYTVAPGDTLSGIAAALGVRGGWQALYAANRRVIGPDPGLIRPGTVLAAPPATAPARTRTDRGGRHAPSSPGTRPGQPGARPSTAGATPGAHRAGSTHGTATAGAAQAAGIMPRWLKGTLLGVALLTVIAFIAPPAAAIGQRRRRDIREQAAARKRDHERRAAKRMAKVIQADHERLIVTYSVSDDTVYLLTPPGEDPRAVLCAARLVLPEDTYEDLVGHLGVPSGWLRE
jgi:LysM repeat protein